MRWLRIYKILGGGGKCTRGTHTMIIITYRLKLEPTTNMVKMGSITSK